MEQPRYKETCDKLFAVLGYSDEEKTEALGALKRKLAWRLLRSVEPDLSEDDRAWIREHWRSATENDPRIKELHEKIHALRSADELAQASHAFFKAILEEYAGFMSDGLDAARAHELRKIASSF